MQGIEVTKTKDINGGDIISIKGAPVIPPIPVKMKVNEGIWKYNMTVSETEMQFNVGMGSPIVVGTSQTYEGPYEVTPKTESQTLQTKDKRMANNVLVKEIPYYETTNIQNGLTVYIAESLND